MVTHEGHDDKHHFSGSFLTIPTVNSPLINIRSETSAIIEERHKKVDFEIKVKNAIACA